MVQRSRPTRRAARPRPLAVRDAELRERMDDPTAPLDALHRTLERFALVNRALGGTRSFYRTHILPRESTEPVRLLDIGAGGADIARHLLALARRDRIALHVTAIDTDPRAVGWVLSRPDRRPPGLAIHRADSSQVRAAGERFDIVTSHHVLHHLSPDEVVSLLDDSVALLRPGGVAVHSDLDRSAGALRSFAAVTALLPGVLRGSWIREDGLASIRRAYRAEELGALAGPQWWVERRRPWRLVAIARRAAPDEHALDGTPSPPGPWPGPPG